MKIDNGWLPIDTAPKDGRAILVAAAGVGAWIAKYLPQYATGYRPDNPWFCLMLNRNYLKQKHPTNIPTHWQPLPEPPSGH